MADLATLRQRLDEAEAALHTMRTEGTRVRLQHDRRQMEFEYGDMAGLEAYILRLKSEIARIEGRSARRGMRVYF